MHTGTQAWWEVKLMRCNKQVKEILQRKVQMSKHCCATWIMIGETSRVKQSGFNRDSMYAGNNLYRLRPFLSLFLLHFF